MHSRSELLESESPQFVGRAVAADPHAIERSGQLCTSWELARAYAFSDDDGRSPDWGALAIDWSPVPPTIVDVIRAGSRLQIEWLETLARRAREMAAKLPARRAGQRDSAALARPSAATRRATSRSTRGRSPASRASVTPGMTSGA